MNQAIVNANEPHKLWMRPPGPFRVWSGVMNMVIVNASKPHKHWLGLSCPFSALSQALNAREAHKLWMGPYESFFSRKKYLFEKVMFDTYLLKTLYSIYKIGLSCKKLDSYSKNWPRYAHFRKLANCRARHKKRDISANFVPWSPIYCMWG